MPCKHYWISGQVQGVFYRSSTQQKAQLLGLTGWVRNLRDGRVEAVACGEDDQLARLESWLYQGPPMASVDHVEMAEEVETTSSDFAIRY